MVLEWLPKYGSKLLLKFNLRLCNQQVKILIKNSMVINNTPLCIALLLLCDKWLKWFTIPFRKYNENTKNEKFHAPLLKSPN